MKHPVERDLRLDLFRGLALWLIFLDHIPSNIVSWITIRNYGFSDATEIFVFISGYTAAFVYGRAMRERGAVVAERAHPQARVAGLCRAYLSVRHLHGRNRLRVEQFREPALRRRNGHFRFSAQPDVTLLQALLLKFKPANMDVLPLYIVLLAGFAPFIWLLLRAPTVALAVSALDLHAELAASIGTCRPIREALWVFNPFAWQLHLRLRRLVRAWRRGTARSIYSLESQYWRSRSPILLFAFRIVMTWYFPRYGHFVPRWLSDWMYPIDKTNLDVLRFAHFLALAVVTVWFIPRDWPYLKSRWFKPSDHLRPAFARNFLPWGVSCLCGSYCHCEVSDRVAMQVVVSVVGH